MKVKLLQYVGFMTSRYAFSVTYVVKLNGKWSSRETHHPRDGVMPDCDQMLDPDS